MCILKPVLACDVGRKTADVPEPFSLSAFCALFRIEKY